MADAFKGGLDGRAGWQSWNEVIRPILMRLIAVQRFISPNWDSAAPGESAAPQAWLQSVLGYLDLNDPMAAAAHPACADGLQPATGSWIPLFPSPSLAKMPFRQGRWRGFPDRSHAR
jgi:hypothetical protein